MTFEQQRDFAIKLGDAAGLWRWSTRPPLWRFLWRLGVKVPPPAFASAWALVIAFGTLFAILGAPIALVAFIDPSRTLAPFTIWVALGLGVGAAMAGLHAAQRHCLGLPEWLDLSSALVIA
jgi:Family of unknown function (DUF6404)